MSTYFTIWHYLFMLLSIILFAAGIYLASKEQNPKIRSGIIISSLLFSLLLAGFSIVVLDKYTKEVILVNVKNSRILRNETIVYQGYVKNVGNYKVGKAEVEIKLVNKGHATGNVKGGNFYKPSGFFSFLYSPKAPAQEAKPQTVVHKFVVATNLEPGKSRYFTVSFPYPPYFSSVSYFKKVFAH